MFNGYMIMSSFVLSVQTLEMLLFMYVFFKHGCDLSRMLVVYGINLLNFISGRSMSLISPNLKQSRKTICAMASNSDVIKPEVFDGASFKRWQIKTRMWLTDLKLFWVVAGVVPKAAADDADAAAKASAKAEKAKWDDANEACLSRLLNVLSNCLFDLYSTFTSAKELWNELD